MPKLPARRIDSVMPSRSMPPKLYGLQRAKRFMAWWRQSAEMRVSAVPRTACTSLTATGRLMVVDVWLISLN